MKRVPRRLFTEEFKKEAIKLVKEQHFTIVEAGRQLDIDPKSIRTWIAQSERGKLKCTLGAAKLTGDQQRIRELERELAIARMERDILKKATAYFAREAK
jgi:transposase